MKGIIYICTTCVKGLIKIGKTGSDQFENRMLSLEQNGYYNVSGLKRYFAVETEDYDEKEVLLHTLFSKSRVASSELFALNEELAKECLVAFASKVIYPKDYSPKNKLSKSQIKATLSVKEVKKRVEDAKNNGEIQKRGRTTFELLKIPVGSTLSFVENPTITCKTADLISKVIYSGTEYSLSALAVKLTPGDNPLQGAKYFTYNGELLWTRRLRLEEEFLENTLDIEMPPIKATKSEQKEVNKGSNEPLHIKREDAQKQNMQQEALMRAIWGDDWSSDF